jgi:hypothetical protein
MLQLENVEFPKETDKNGIEVVATMGDYLAPLVEKLALAHPEWQFKSHHCHKVYGKTDTGADFSMVVERVKVVDKYEELGLLGTDYTSKGKRFYVSNHRTEKMRERGSGMKTIHLDKAYKHVDKFFGRMNHGEKIEQASRETTDAVYRVMQESWYPLRGAWQEVEEIAKTFVVDNLDTFKSYMQTNSDAKPTQIQAVDKLPALLAECLGMQAMHSSVEKDEHILVLLDGMNYIVKHKNQVEVKASEELPDYVRRGVGMLKLVEVKHAITNIGVRVDENTFALISPNNVS